MISVHCLFLGEKASALTKLTSIQYMGARRNVSWAGTTAWTDKSGLFIGANIYGILHGNNIWRHHFQIPWEEGDSSAPPPWLALADSHDSCFSIYHCGTKLTFMAMFQEFYFWLGLHSPRLTTSLNCVLLVFLFQSAVCWESIFGASVCL